MLWTVRSLLFLDNATNKSVYARCVELTMAFKNVTATTANFCHLLIGLLLATLTAASSLNISNITTESPRTEPSFCVFPNFLQTNCSGSTGVCEWNLGKRLALPRWLYLSPPSKFRTLRGTSQWRWVVLNSTIRIKATTTYSPYSPYSPPLSRPIQREFHCISNRGLDNSTFIISKKDVLGERKQDANDTYCCIRFLKRGENVIQYKLGSWKSSLKDVDCRDKGLVLQEYLLISDNFHGLLDCPFKLRGAFEILYIYDARKQRICTYGKGSFGLLESDCLNKEGLYIDFGSNHNCTNPNVGNSFPSEMNLRCLSKPWEDGVFTYFVTARRARWLHEYEKTTVQCVRFKTTSGPKDELTLTIFNEPICKRSIKNSEKVKADDMFALRIRRRENGHSPKYHLSGRCMFPKELQGSWLEQSVHEGNRKITIKGGNITINPYGSFECKERFTLTQGHPSVCGFGEEGDRWLGQGQVRFYYDDYLLISQFENGCRTRITRLGLTSTVNKHILIYRLSQSEPLVNEVKTPDEYYYREIVRRFCRVPYVYQRDPFPHWGRNIEKIIHRKQLPVQNMSKCSLVFNSRHDLLSVVAGTSSSTCRKTLKTPQSMIHFGCPESSLRALTTLKVLYSPSCKMKDVTFSCIGKAWKFGNYVLLRDSVTQRINCFWFDKENNAILRLDSSQCSDTAWGRLPGHPNKFAERFEIKYFKKCPLIEVEPTKKGRSTAAVAAVNQVVWFFPLVLAATTAWTLHL